MVHHQRLTLSLKCSSLEDLYGIKQLTVVPDWEDWMFSADVVPNSPVSLLLRLTKALPVPVVDVTVVYPIVSNWSAGMPWPLSWTDIL